MPLGPTVTSAWASVIELFGTAVSPANAGNDAKHNAVENTKVRVFMKNLLVDVTQPTITPYWRRRLSKIAHVSRGWRIKHNSGPSLLRCSMLGIQYCTDSPLACLDKSYPLDFEQRGFLHIE
jgi:hypothetical protein